QWVSTVGLYSTSLFQAMSVRLAKRISKRNVIGAPVPPEALATVYARLLSRIDQIESVLATLRAIVCGGLLLLLLSLPDVPRTAEILLAGYVIVSVMAMRAFILVRPGRTTIDRLIVVGDVIFVPFVLVSAMTSTTAIHVVITCTGFWVCLNALTANVKYTRDRIAGYLTMSFVAAVALMPDGYAAVVPVLIAVGASS